MISTKSVANAVGGKTARACDSCVRKRARWYCAADDAFLCQACDTAVHSANSLARRHDRVRLKSASSKPRPDSPSPSWHGGFTRKARTPRPPPRRPKSDDLLSLLSNPSFSLVPEADEATSREDNEDDHLLYRVPTFDPFVAENESKLVDSGNLHGFLPSDMDLAEFAADVESLLGRNLESECFDMEGLGLVDCKDKDDTVKGSCSFGGGGGRVKVEEEEACRLQQQFDAEVDLMREPFELNFEDYDDAPGSCCKEDQKTIAAAATAAMVGVKNEREDYMVDESKTKKKRKVTLRLDREAVIATWGSGKSPWTTGERPDFDPDDERWPNCMAICGVSYGHVCGDFGGSWGQTAAMADGGREARVSRYREKRRTRLFSKKIRYEVRKLNAEKRPRMKGRFVKRTPFAQPTHPILTIK